MRDIATATLSGNLTRGVELRLLAWVQTTNYFTVEVYGAEARSCKQYLLKGCRGRGTGGDTTGNGPGTKWVAFNAIAEHLDYPQSDVMRSRWVAPRVRWSAVVLDFG